MNNPHAASGIRVLAPAVFFVCIISVYRGYAQGFGNMMPTAASQIVEVVCKAVFGIVAAMWLINRGYSSYTVSAGAIMGVSIGLALCIPLLVWYKRNIDRGITSDESSEDLPGRFRVLGRLMKVSIPITLSASFMSLMVVIDNSIVLGRLQTWLVNTEEVAAAAVTLAAERSMEMTEALAEASEVASSALFGIFTRGLTVYNLPPALIVPVAVSIVPAIAAELAKHRKSEAGDLMRSSIKLTNLLAMPACAGIVVLSGPILIALFNDSREMTSNILALLGAASFFVCLQHITMAILQAGGHERIAMLTFPVGGVLKIVLSVILVGNPNIGIIGSPIGTLVCFAIISLLNLYFIRTKLKESPKIISVYLKPLICSAVMATISFVVYELLYRLGSGVIGSGRIAVCLYLSIAIFVGVLVYALLIIVTRTITKEDMTYVPKGEKLARVLKIK
jgi:stage V sporulation protein B